MFEFDPDKSESNRMKHGIDFYDARKLWKDSRRIEIRARWVDEARFILIGQINQQLWSAIYTLREDKIRIISVRRARSNEKEIYHSSRI